MALCLYRLYLYLYQARRKVLLNRHLKLGVIIPVGGVIRADEVPLEAAPSPRHGIDKIGMLNGRKKGGCKWITKFGPRESRALKILI